MPFTSTDDFIVILGVTVCKWLIFLIYVNFPKQNEKKQCQLAKLLTINFESDVIIEYKGLKASCKSLLEIIMLGINSMAKFTVSAIGKDAHNAINAIKAFFESLLHDKTYEDALPQSAEL